MHSEPLPSTTVRAHILAEPGGSTTGRLRARAPPRFRGPGYSWTCPRQEELRPELCDHIGAQEGFWENPVTETRSKISPGKSSLRLSQLQGFVTNHPNTKGVRNVFHVHGLRSSGRGSEPREEDGPTGLGPWQEDSGAGAGGRLLWWVVLSTWVRLGFLTAWQKPQRTLGSSFRIPTATLPLPRIKAVTRSQAGGKRFQLSIGNGPK